jgi:hypothetical protein
VVGWVGLVACKYASQCRYARAIILTRLAGASAKSRGGAGRFGVVVLLHGMLWLHFLGFTTEIVGETTWYIVQPGCNT